MGNSSFRTGASWAALLTGAFSSSAACAQSDGSVLPFPPTASTSIAAPTLAESKLTPFPAENHLPKGAPNILVILLDDIGFVVADTFGGPVHTPTLSRLADEGIRYNTFCTTSICSPTRAALLTRRVKASMSKSIWDHRSRKNTTIADRSNSTAQFQPSTCN